MNTAPLALLVLLGIGLSGCIQPPPPRDPPSEAQRYCEEQLAADANTSCTPQLEALIDTKGLDATLAKRLARFCDELYEGSWGEQELACLSHIVRDSTDLSRSWALASRAPDEAHGDELVTSCEEVFGRNDIKVACVKLVLQATTTPITNETSLDDETNAVEECAAAFEERFPDSLSNTTARLNWLRTFICVVDNTGDGSYGQVSTWLEECVTSDTSNITLPDDLPTCLLARAALEGSVCEP